MPGIAPMATAIRRQLRIVVAAGEVSVSPARAARQVVPAAADDVQAGPGGWAGLDIDDQVRSKRSRFMTLSQAATKSRANFSLASSHA